MIIDMFDSPEAYAENFSALKAITRGLYYLPDRSNFKNDRVTGLFKTVNNLQGILLLDDIHEVEEILQDSGLMPDRWQVFRKNRNGGEGCV